MEGAAMHFPQGHCSRYTSPISIPAYQPSYDYLSPPSSSTQSPTSDVRFTSSPAGLGITHYHNEPPNNHQGLRIRDTVQQAAAAIKSEHNFFAAQGAKLPSQYMPQASYSTNAGCSSYYSMSRSYYDSFAPSSIEATLDMSRIEYQPDVPQDRKWEIAAPEELYLMPQTQFNTMSWDYSGPQHYPTPKTYAVQCLSNDSTPSGQPDSVSSTPPALQEGTSMQQSDTRFPTRTYVDSESIKCETIGTIESVENIHNIRPKSESPQVLHTVTTLQSTSKALTKNKKSACRARKAQSARPTLYCRHCHKSFSKQTKLREHENNHEPTPVICHETFPTPEGARTCGKEYGRPADLARHQRSVHKHLKLPCKYCSKTFNRSDIVRRHEEQSCKMHRIEQAIQGQVVHKKWLRQ